jgi:hypothetical protein
MRYKFVFLRFPITKLYRRRSLQNEIPVPFSPFIREVGKERPSGTAFASKYVVKPLSIGALCLTTFSGR